MSFYYDYEDHNFYPENPYYVANQANGHAYNCADAGGGDCTCGKYPHPDEEPAPTFPMWKVTVTLCRGERAEKKDWAVAVCSTFEAGKAALKRYGKWDRATLKRVNNAEELENAEFQVYKVEDWATD
jgi:hypothetical protein